MITIRKATKRDLPVLLLLIQSLFEHDNTIDPTYEISPKKANRSLKYMKGYLGKKGEAYFLAHDKEIPVGYVHTSIDTLKDKSKQGYISELFVIRTYRGKGIGRRLIREQEKWLKAKKVLKVIVSTTEKKNKLTIDFYKKLNYKIYKNLEDKRKNIIYFKKTL